MIFPIRYMPFDYNSVFLTYGDERFSHSRKRIIFEAKKTGLFNRCCLETENILSDFEFQEALKSQDFLRVFSDAKGGGCYIWKPYVIYKNLLSLDHDDILVYADAGCTVCNDDHSINKFLEYFRATKDPTGIVAFRSHHLESEESKGDVFEYFNISRSNEEICNTPKYSAGRIVIRKCEHSMDFFKRWWEIAKSEPLLFSSSHSKTPNFPNFFRHIWDSSTLSILCKTMGVVDQPWTEDDIPMKATRLRF